MRKPKIIALSAAILCLFLLSNAALAGSGPAITSSVMGGGGGLAEQGGYSLNGTIGQAFTGYASSGDYGACSGFWCRATDGLYNLFLSLLSKP